MFARPTKSAEYYFEKIVKLFSESERNTYRILNELCLEIKSTKVEQVKKAVNVLQSALSDLSFPNAVMQMHKSHPRELKLLKPMLQAFCWAFPHYLAKIDDNVKKDLKLQTLGGKKIQFYLDLQLSGLNSEQSIDVYQNLIFIKPYLDAEKKQQVLSALNQNLQNFDFSQPNALTKEEQFYLLNTLLVYTKRLSDKRATEILESTLAFASSLTSYSTLPFHELISAATVAISDDEDEEAELDTAVLLDFITQCLHRVPKAALADIADALTHDCAWVGDANKKALHSFVQQLPYQHAEQVLFLLKILSIYGMKVSFLCNQQLTAIGDYVAELKFKVNHLLDEEIIDIERIKTFLEQLVLCFPTIQNIVRALEKDSLLNIDENNRARFEDAEVLARWLVKILAKLAEHNGYLECLTLILPALKKVRHVEMIAPDLFSDQFIIRLLCLDIADPIHATESKRTIKSFFKMFANLAHLQNFTRQVLKLAQHVNQESCLYALNILIERLVQPSKEIKQAVKSYLEDLNYDDRPAADFYLAQNIFLQMKLPLHAELANKMTVTVSRGLAFNEICALIENMEMKNGYKHNRYQAILAKYLLADADASKLLTAIMQHTPSFILYCVSKEGLCERMINRFARTDYQDNPFVQQFLQALAKYMPDLAVEHHGIDAHLNLKFLQKHYAGFQLPNEFTTLNVRDQNKLALLHELNKTQKKLSKKICLSSDSVLSKKAVLH